MPAWDDPGRWSVVVTGGSSGLGAAVCRRVRHDGAVVVSLDCRPPDDDGVPTEIVDLADIDQAAAATERAVDRLGGVDAVVCCAGVDQPGRLLDIDPAQWRRIVEINLFGTMAVVRAALPSLGQRSGRVVTVASTLGHRAVADGTAYCASKFGVVGFTRALAAELKGQVGVTMLTPGGMDTRFFDDRDDRYKPPPGAILALPHDVADAVVWALQRPVGLEVRELSVMAPVEGSWP